MVFYLSGVVRLVVLALGKVMTQRESINNRLLHQSYESDSGSHTELAFNQHFIITKAIEVLIECFSCNLRLLVDRGI